MALIFGPGDELLYIRRSERDGDPWSGHMAFPGGREEPEDASPRETAERETREEVGLDLDGARFVGALDVQHSPVRDPGFTFGIFPFVYVVDGWPPLTLSDEVAGVHRFALSRLLAGEGRGDFRYVGYGYDRVLPCLRLDEAFIWGLTLRMTDDLLERVRAAGGDR